MPAKVRRAKRRRVVDGTPPRPPEHLAPDGRVPADVEALLPLGEWLDEADPENRFHDPFEFLIWALNEPGAVLADLMRDYARAEPA